MTRLPEGCVSPGALVTDPDIVATYAVDSSYGAEPAPDVTLVRAAGIDDVIAVMREAQAHGIPVVPQGARTALTGASCAVAGGIILNVEDLQGIDIDPVEGHAWVGPGVVTAEIRTWGVAKRPRLRAHLVRTRCARLRSQSCRRRLTLTVTLAA